MELEFCVKGQVISRTDNEDPIVNETANYIDAEFTFTTSEWNGLDKYALFKAEKGKAYCVELGTGLSKSGTTLNHSNSVTAQTSFGFKKFKFDSSGHITAVDNVVASDLPSHTHSYTSTNDVQSEISAFATALASAINPSS